MSLVYKVYLTVLGHHQIIEENHCNEKICYRPVGSRLNNRYPDPSIPFATQFGRR